MKEKIFSYGPITSLIIYALALPLSMAATNFAVGLLVAFLVWYLIEKKVDKNQFSKSILLLLVFFFWASITKWISYQAFDWSALKSFQRSWNFFPIFLIPMIGLKDELFLRKILKTFVIASSAVVLLGAIQYWTGIHYFFEGWFGADALIQVNRFYGFQSHPLHSGGLYCMVFLVALSLALFSSPSKTQPDKLDQWLESKKSYSLFWFTLSAILALGVILTQSRSYYLALLVGTLILLGMKGWKTLGIGLLIGTVLTLGAVSTIPSFKNRIASLNYRKTDDSAKMRTYMWRAASYMIQDHPWTGIGYGRWREEVETYSQKVPEWNLDKASFAHTHNSLISVTTETGWIGLFLFLSFWIGLALEQLKNLRNQLKSSFTYPISAAALAIIAALGVASFFEHNLLTATIGLTLSFVLGMSRLNFKRG